MMMTLLAARIDRNEHILLNARLDGYPANFKVDPALIDAVLGVTSPNADVALERMQQQWAQVAPVLEKLVRRHGNDFLATADMIKR
jgi:hypothetical protein